MEETIFCKHCGRKIAPYSQYCQYCGGNLQELEPPNWKEMNMRKESCNKVKSKNRVLPLFLWALVVSAICTIGYAIVRYEDSKPYDKNHYWGSSTYDTNGMLWGDDYGDQLTQMRKVGYEKGIKNMVLYSFPISFGILLIGALLNNSTKK